MVERKVCLVAGAGPGIGFAVAKRFAAEGFAVALLARGAEALAEFVRRIEGTGGVANGYPVDLADAAAIRSTIARVVAEMGPVEVLVYNAAPWHREPVMTVTTAAFHREMAVCAGGALVSAQAVYPSMKERGEGTMLFTGGGLALHPEQGAGEALLTAGKSAMRGLVLAMAKELAADGIHVATVTIAGFVAPGSAFDPDVIASRYWELHSQGPAEWSAEIVFGGAE
jgi:NAD(P)-dependent dehydrogenase (short-subunit alcohol dehydrogenase family)